MPLRTLQHYVAKISEMHANDDNTMLVQYTHLMSFDQMLATAITGDFVRCVDSRREGCGRAPALCTSGSGRH